MLGNTISHYKIIEKLGEGGMGVVYRAVDIKLDREVAIKFLPAHLSSDAEAIKRFIHEAKAASAIDHSHIGTIYEIDEADDGVTFIVMALYDGETLRERIDRGMIGVEEALNITTQIASGLSKAHSKDIVHRDIKPSNIIITSDGEVKIIDFGLAKLSGRTRLTKEASTLGTAAYMSPEQARGDEVDHRTDIWSVGAVMYEMLAGKLPFRGDYEPAVVYSILNEDPEPLTNAHTEIPLEVEQLIGRALAKDPEKRFQSVEELIAELKELLDTLDLLPKRSGLQLKLIRQRRRIASIASSSILVVALAILGFRYFTGAAQAIDSIAVLPFENVSGDHEQEYFADGVTREITATIGQISGWKKVTASRTMMQYKSTDKSPGDIASEVEVKALLTASIQLLSGNRVETIVELIDGTTENLIWTQRYDCELSEINGLLNDIARTAGESAGIDLSRNDIERLEAPAAVDAAAYKAYLMGVLHSQDFNDEAWRKGIEYFNQAIEIDVTFAPAYAGLARCYNFLDWFYSDADYLAMQKAAVEKALEFDPNLAEAHVARANMLYQKEFAWDRSEREFLRAIDLDHNSYSAHRDYGIFLILAGRFDEAFPKLIRARDLDPLSYESHRELGLAYVNSHRCDEGIDYLMGLRERFPGNPRTEWFLAHCYSGMGMHETAMALIDSLEVEEPGWKNISVNIFAAGGKVEEALAVLAERERAGESETSIALGYFGVYAYSGQIEKALFWAEKVYELSPVGVMYLNRMPLPLEIRSDPRFQDIIQRVGLGE